MFIFIPKKKFSKFPPKQQLLFLAVILFVLLGLINYFQNNPPQETEPKQEIKTGETVEPENIFRDDVIDVGIFTFGRVIDGDTIHIKEIKEPLRLLCVDTEESFKSNEEKSKELAETNWKTYLNLKYKKENPRPIKYPTPMGDKASGFADEFFNGVAEIKLERDSIDRVYDFFGRPLCYVFAMKNDEWINFNIELVRNGFSPYYAKYGYSLRYHEKFMEAESEAREKKLGIWSPVEKMYPDYDLRTTWWTERAENIKLFEETHGDDNSYFFVQNDTDWKRLKEHVGSEITIFGTVDRIRFMKKPYHAYISHNQKESVIVYTEDDELIDSFKTYSAAEIYVYFKGTLEFSNDDYMMSFTDPSQLRITP